MRLWLKDSERRPDPVPVVTADRPAVFVGTALWLVAAVALLIAGVSGAPADPRLVWTCVVGVALGLVGLLYLRFRR